MAKKVRLSTSKEIRRQRAKKAQQTTFNTNNKYDYIKRPIISEKTMAQTEDKVYTFEVEKMATKRDIKVLIEEIYGVQVASVRTVNTKKKPKTVGRYQGYRSGFKKAIIKLTAESKEIEAFDI